MQFCYKASVLVLFIGLNGCKRTAAPVATSPTRAPLPPIGKELCTTDGFSVKRLDPKALPSTRYVGIGKTDRKVEGRSLTAVICYVWATTVARTDWNTSLPDGFYEMALPGTDNTRYATQTAFAQAFHEAFHLKIYAREEDRSVLLLKAPGGRVPSGLTPSGPGEDQFKGVNYSGAEFKGYTMDKFADWIEAQWEGKPVINETNLSGTYNFTVKGNVILDSDSVPKFVSDLGFEEVTETRRMHVIIVEKE